MSRTTKTALYASLYLVGITAGIILSSNVLLGAGILFGLAAARAVTTPRTAK